MRKLLTLAASLLLAGAVAVAQDTTPVPAPGTQQSAPAATPNDKTQNNGASISGCLNGSDGSYTLTDQSGMTYQLKGATADMKQHVGHQVELMGATTGSESTASASASRTEPPASSASSSKTFTVTSMKHLADTCTPSAQLGPGVSSTPDQPATGKPATTGGVAGGATDQQLPQSSASQSKPSDPAGVASPANPNSTTPENPAGNVLPQPSQPTPRPQDQTPDAGTAAPTSPTGSVGDQPLPQSSASQTTSSPTSTTSKSKSQKKTARKPRTSTTPSDSSTTPPPSSSTPPPQL